MRNFWIERLGLPKLGLHRIACSFLSLLLLCGASQLRAEVETAPSSSSARLSGSIKIDGSSTVYPLTEAVVEEFGKHNRGVKTTVGISGTGGGMKRFIAGETDISNASRPIREVESKAALANGVNYVELKVGYDAMTVVVHPDNSWVDSITVEELKRIWEPAAQGKIMTWKQVRADWPDQPLKLYGPGVDSGTFDYFTETIVGKEKASRGDFTASEDDNIVVQGVSGDKNSLGYFGLAYFQENSSRLKAVPVVNSETGKAVMPSAQAVIDGTYRPLARPMYIYVRSDSLLRPEVREFVTYYIKNAPTLAPDVGYVGLSEKEQASSLATLTSALQVASVGTEKSASLAN